MNAISYINGRTLNTTEKFTIKFFFYLSLESELETTQFTEKRDFFPLFFVLF